MSRPVWLRETKWLGAEGVREKVERWARPERIGRPVDGLEDLLSRPEWAGATVAEVGGGVFEVTHPSGARARVREVALEMDACHRRDCQKDAKGSYPRRCPGCGRRVCSHRVGFKSRKCPGCETEVRIAWMHGKSPG